MTLDTLLSIIIVVLFVVSIIGMKVGEKFVYVKYYDQKVGEKRKWWRR